MEADADGGTIPVTSWTHPLGSLADIEEIVRRHDADELVVAPALGRDERLAPLERVGRPADVRVRLPSGLLEVPPTTATDGETLAHAALRRASGVRLSPIEAAVKRALDYGLTLPAVVVLLPVLALIALCIKLDSPGPVLYRRRVLGVGGTEFDAFKFRTMSIDGDTILARRPELLTELRANHKLRRDPRLTRIGRRLRRYSLDELPQLFNVLRGEMSLVGPRMISPAEAEHYGELTATLLTVKPGLTGLWQVSGRSDVSYQERVRLDMEYIRAYTVWRDLQILFIRTLPIVLTGRGAY